ncbi:DNA protecting protein DprA [Methylocella silvestris BL2]|uniref:DNA protecting protein DprA n=1 Tax=Methylocella silvestris (strain DSM 15510 / CIP 108128 / LMG 27833 / NCIMB 13906 / BL2) TaxID=395965 RepID=B8EMR0_METSB|nr:DNA-processing protein DprA [Methylocella silvestris]ACK52739.1 DNA protecting protein DprA [Methylocella silvestris BL2]
MTSAAALTPQERFAFLRLYRSETIGPRTFVALLARYGSAQAALEALPGVVASGKAGRPIALAPVHEIEAELEAIERAGATLICLPEPDYPALLRQIHSAPPLLTMRGDRACLKRSKIAIVGARNASAAGLAFTEQLSRGIARAGYVIVSGLARGVDARAHQAALATGTIAVLAGGLGNIYPAAHAELVERLIETGAAVSEMPFGWEARGRDFPRRNRIVSGLSRGVVVVEAARRSGSLITAGFAAEQGREVFAVPGSPLDPRAEGPNQLLRDGATLCTGPEDVLDALARQDLSPPADFSFAEAQPQSYESFWDELDLPDIFAAQGGAANGAAEQISSRPAPASSRRAALPPPADEPPREDAPAPSREAAFARVIALLGPSPVSVDELVRASEAPAREVRAILFELELQGRLERHGADLVSKI